MQSYLLRTTTSIQRVIGIFCFMILSSWVLMAQPSNNSPCGAIPLPLSNQCTWVEGTNEDATNSAVMPRPSCGNYSGGDVWYVVQVPSTGSVEINTKAGQLKNMTMAAYSANSCSGPFTQIACAEEGSTVDYLMPKITINNRTPGSYVFIRIFDHVCSNILCGANDPHQRGTFFICASVGYGNVTSGSNPVGSYNCNNTPVAGNTCETATPICTFNGYCGSTTGYSANYWYNGSRGLGGPLTAQGVFCGSIENNSFIKFVAGASSVQLNVIVNGSSCSDGIQFMMFNNPTGGPTCQSLDIISYGCEYQMYPGSNTFVATGLTYGQEYILMVDGFGGDRCNYQINAVSGVLVRMSAGQDRTICLGETVSLSVYGAGTGSITWTGSNLNSTAGQTVTATPTTTGTFQYIVDAPTLNPACVGQPRDKDTVLVTVIAPMGNVGLSQSGGGCSGGTVTLTASGGSTYTWTPTTGLNNTTGAVVTATPAVTTTYTVKASNGSGCPNTNSITVTASGGPALTVSTSKDTICTGGTGSVLTASPGFTTYSWSPTTGLSPTTGATVTANPSSVGNYTYTVTGTLAGCPNTTATKTITVISGAVVNVTPASPIICNGQSVTLTASPAGVYNWIGPSGFTQNGVGAITVSPTSNATYTATGITCPSLGSATVNITSLPAALTAVNGSRCGTGTVGLSVTGACAGTINWYATNVSTTSLGTGSSFTTPSISSTTTYYASCTAGSCEGPRVPVVATINTTPPNANAGPAGALTCAVSSVQLNGSSTTPGVTYSWSGPGIVSGGNTATPTVNAAGTYTLSVTNPATGCTNTAQTTVSSSGAIPNASAGTSKTLTCTSTTVVLDGSSSTAGVTFSWSGPGIVSGGNTATPTVNAAGTYTLTVTNPANGCTNTAQTTVSSSGAIPNASAGANKTLTCTITTIALEGSSTTPGVTFSWSGPGIISGGNTATPTVNAAGTYALIVTDPANGCTNTSQANVSGNTILPNASAGSNKTLTCTTTAITLDGSSSTPGATFSWSGNGIVSGGNTATPTVNTNGTFILSVTNPANGCTSTTQVNVTSNTTTPDVNAGPDRALTCTVSSVQLAGSSTTPGASFSWSGPGITSGGNTASPTVNTPGTYTLTVSNPANGCSATGQASVSSSGTPPNANAGGDKTLTCTITSVTLNGSSATPGVSFSWSGPGIVSGGNTATPSANAAGTYTLTVTDPANSCTATASTTINSNTTSPQVNAGADAIINCAVGSVQLSGSSATTGATFAWSGPGITGGGNTTTPTVNAPGTYTLTVSNPANGCTATDEAMVTNGTDLPDANAGPDQIIDCRASSVQLQGSSSTSGVTVSWTGPGITAGSGTFTPTVNAAGNYTMTITNPANGCVYSDLVAVRVAEPMVISANITPNPCAQLYIGAITVTVSGGIPPYTFTWSNGSSAQSLSGISGGQYDLIVTDSTGCREELSYTVPQGIFEVVAYYDSTINVGESIQLFGIVSGGSGEEVFAWSPPDYLNCTDCEDPVSTPLQNIVYYLTVTDTNGCSYTDSILIKISKFFDLYIPNTFTPNNDGVNDQFVVLGDTENVQTFSMWVFNRWQEILFYTEDIETGWDGTYKGRDQPLDVYTYVIHVTFSNGKSEKYKGYIVLIR
jgi:gliding motility-associated-like protein